VHYHSLNLPQKRLVALTACQLFHAYKAREQYVFYTMSIALMHMCACGCLQVLYVTYCLQVFVSNLLLPENLV